MRFFPDEASKPPVVQEEDLCLLSVLYKAGAMTTPMMLALDARKPSVIYDRLHRFTAHGWLAKVPNGLRNHTWDPNKPDVYVLGWRGIQLARDYSGLDRKPLREQDIAHCLDNAIFVLSFQLAFQATGRELTEWLPDGVVTFTFADQTLHPDGFLLIKDAPYFLRLALEIDLSTESNTMFLKDKIQRYVAFIESSERQEQAPWGFRVVVVTRSEARKENLRRLAREYGRWWSLF
jgi:Replication-relaxation